MLRTYFTFYLSYLDVKFNLSHIFVSLHSFVPVDILTDFFVATGYFLDIGFLVCFYLIIEMKRVPVKLTYLDYGHRAFVLSLVGLSIAGNSK